MLICLEEINLNKEFFRKKLEHSLLKGQLSKSGKEKPIEVIWHYEIKMILDLRKNHFS